MASVVKPKAPKKKMTIKKKKIEAKPQTTLSVDLTYEDYSDDELDQKEKHQCDLSLLAFLPKTHCELNKPTKTKTEEEDDDEDENQDDESKIEKEDIDYENLIKDNHNGKIIYYDYNKNIVYDTEFNEVGEIDDEGEIFYYDTK